MLGFVLPCTTNDKEMVQKLYEEINFHLNEKYEMTLHAT
jgi:hypothetical protein